MDSLHRLADQWRERADTFEEWADAKGAARALRKAADELDAAVREALDEPLTLAEAARECSYSKRTLRQKVADGEIPNAGEKGRPRIRRGDLPRKADRNRGAAYDVDANAARVLGRIDGAA